MHQALPMLPKVIHLPIQESLPTGIQVELDFIHPQEQEQVRALVNRAIAEGLSFAQDRPLSPAEFAADWLAGDGFVARADGEVLGAFNLKPNFSGRCSHIATAGFVVQPAFRGRGLGQRLGARMLEIASWRGYTAVMFNLVFDSQKSSIPLWRSLGFSTIGRIPQAARLADGQGVDAYIMYRSLS